MKRREPTGRAGRARLAVRRPTKLLKFLQNESQFKSFVLLFKPQSSFNLKAWFVMTLRLEAGCELVMAGRVVEVIRL